MRSHTLETLEDEVIGVYGFGRTGQALVECLHPIATEIRVYDDTDPDKIKYDRSNWPNDIKWNFIPTALDTEIDRLLVSPGIPGDHSFLRQAREFRIPVWGELELAYRLSSGMIWGVTGTNGKSTVTELVGAILRARYGNEAVSVCGNRGKPMIESVRSDSVKYDHFVVEISSFQVEGLVDFEPDAMLLTNLGNDHLDRHTSIREYHGLKMDLLKRTNPGDRLTVHDPVFHDSEFQWITDRANVTRFDESRTIGCKPECSFDPENGFMIGDTRLRSLETVPRILQFYPQNLLAALAFTCTEPDIHEIDRALEAFDPLPHRVEQIPTKNGRTILNDSKATNPSAVTELLDQITGQVSLVLGGSDKNSDFSEMLDRLSSDQVCSVWLAGSGTTTEKLIKLCSSRGIPFEHVPEWEDSVKRAIRSSDPDQVVLLSPGGTSFDAFENYKSRGKAFRQWVREEAK